MKNYLTKILVIILILFLNTLPSKSKTAYLSGEDLKNFLLLNEITIKYENITHSYMFNSDFTYRVSAYPKRENIGSGKWNIYGGYGVGPGYNSSGGGADYLSLVGFRSGLQNANFVFQADKKFIKIVGNLLNPDDYVSVNIVSILDKNKVKVIVAEQLEKERLEQQRLSKIQQERLEKERLEKERLEKIQLEKELLEKERIRKAEEKENWYFILKSIVIFIITISIVAFIFIIKKQNEERIRIEFINEEKKIDDLFKKHEGLGLISAYEFYEKHRLEDKFLKKYGNLHLKITKFCEKVIEENNKENINLYKKVLEKIKELNNFMEQADKKAEIFLKKYPYLKSLLKRV